jgi:hypothetical protein
MFVRWQERHPILSLLLLALLSTLVTVLLLAQFDAPAVLYEGF